MSGAIWRESKIEDLSRKVTVGFVGSQAPHFVDDGVPLLRGQNIKPWRIEFDNLKYISPATHQKWSKSSLQPGDVVIVRVGYPGTAAVVPDGVGDVNAASLVIVKPDSTKLDPHFLAHLLNSPWGKHAVAARFVGAAQQVLNTTAVAEMKINHPGLDGQRAIARTLNHFNELIENNRRRVGVLEEMARAIYREWFVHFRFPGHEDATFVESDLGPIPEGWDVGVVGDVLTLQRGFDLPTGSRTPGPVPIMAASGVGGSHNEAKVDGPGVVTGRSGTVGQVFYVRESYWPLNTALWVKSFHRSNPLHAWFFLEALDVGRLAGGAAVPTLNRNVVHSETVAVPPHEIVDRFAEFVGPLIDLGRTADRAADEAATLRDLLLPRLVTGQIDVSDVDLDAVVETAEV